MEHSHLHGGVCMAVCCLLVCDALAGVGGIRLRTPSNLLHPGLQQRGQVRARVSSHGVRGGSCHPLRWPQQHIKIPSCPPSLSLGQISLSNFLRGRSRCSDSCYSLTPWSSIAASFLGLGIDTLLKWLWVYVVQY